MRLCQLAVVVAVSLPPPALALRKHFRPYNFGDNAPLFVEQFAGQHRWVSSESKKVVVESHDGSSGGGSRREHKYDGVWGIEEPTVYPGFIGDAGLTLKSAPSHYAVSTPIKPILFDGKEPFVLQYEVKLQQGLECGGAYVKLFRAPPDSSASAAFSFRPERVDDKSPYSLMFGPDRCGETDKVHLIIQHMNRQTGKVTEKQLTEPPMTRNTKLSTLYTLIIRPDASFEIRINREEARRGSLLHDFMPPINTPAEMDDPNDAKPADWVDNEKIPDLTAVKPADWDEGGQPFIEDKSVKMPDGWLVSEPEMIPDPDATRPPTWNDAEEGAWEAPLVLNPKCTVGCGEWRAPMRPNPLYKGKWAPPMVENPAYRGPWKARQIPNPDFYEDPQPTAFLPAIGIGFELWTMQGGVHIDNIILTNDEEQAASFAEATWMRKYDMERVELEKDLRAQGISDDPGEQSDAEEDATIQVPIAKRLGIAWKLLSQETQRFARLVRADPKRAIFAYPLHALNGLLLTILLMYCIAAFVSWLVAGTAPPAAAKKLPQDAQAVQHVQKTQQVAKDESLTLTERESPSRLPRPTMPVRPLKYSGSYRSSSTSEL